MATWLSAEEISRVFLVQQQTLVSYSARGNLGVRTDVRGQRVFNPRQVESLFPRRGQGQRRSGSLGTLGQAKLGPRQPSTLRVGPGYRSSMPQCDNQADFGGLGHIKMAKIA